MSGRTDLTALGPLRLDDEGIEFGQKASPSIIRDSLGRIVIRPRPNDDPDQNRVIIENSGVVHAQAGAVLGTGLAHVDNEHAMRIALGLNNGAVASTVPRRRGFTVNDYTAANLLSVSSDAHHFQFAIFDGRSIIYLPFGTFAAVQGTVVRYDITKPFDEVESFTSAHLPTLLNNTKAAGFIGGCIDVDGWLYFCPCAWSDGGVEFGNQTFVRFFTPRELNDRTAYQQINLVAQPPSGTGTAALTPNYSWQGCCYDGRYVYYSACNDPSDPAVTHGEVVRFDTQGPEIAGGSAFNNPDNFTVYDTTAVHAQALGYLGCQFDGQHVYFAPFGLASGVTRNGRFVRYNTAAYGGFTDDDSWESVDLETLLTPSTSFASAAANSARAVGFCYCVVVGPYVYLVPWGGGSDNKRSLAVRYDTRLPFTDAQSYTTFDLRTIARRMGDIAGVTNTANATVTSVDEHNLRPGDRIIIAQTLGATGINGLHSVVTTPTDTTFTVANTVAPGVWTAEGKFSDGADECIGYQSGAFDGQYLHFTPTGQENRIGSYKTPPYVRNDVRLPFDEATSWLHVNTPLSGTGELGGLNPFPSVSTGSTSDGRYIYHVPYLNALGFCLSVRADCGAPGPGGLVDPLPELYRGPSRLGEAVVIEDDFETGGVLSGNVGSIGMQFVTTGAGGGVAYADVLPNHPGIVTFTTGDTDDGNNALAYKVGEVGVFFLNANAADPFDLTWIVRTEVVTAEPTYRIGLSNNPSVAGGQPTNGIYFEKLSADTAFWRIVIRTAGAEVRYNTGVAYAAETWYRFRIKWDSPYIKYSVNGQALQAFGAPQQAAGSAWLIPVPVALPTQAMSPMVTVVPTTAASQTISIDYTKFLHAGMNR